jgi:hypothetical protein
VKRSIRINSNPAHQVAGRVCAIRSIFGPGDAMVRFTAVRPRRARSCASAGSEHQWRHYRLYGKLDDCEHVRELFATCMSLKAALPGTKRTQVGDPKSIGAPRF